MMKDRSFARWSRKEDYKAGIKPSGMRTFLSSWRAQLNDEKVKSHRLARLEELRGRLEEDEEEAEEEESDYRSHRRNYSNMNNAYTDMILGGGGHTPPTLQLSQEDHQTSRESTQSHFKNMLCLPLHLVEIPDDFNQGEWLMTPRPEGQIAHCMIRNGRAIVRGKNGRVLCWGFVCHWPNTTSILYGIYNDRTFFALDGLMWNGISLCEWAAVNRIEFISSRIEERNMLTNAIHGHAATGSLDIVNRTDQWHKATKNKFCETYDQAENEIRQPDSALYPDGILFLHGESYHLPGLSPFFLHFKDPKLCRYPIDTAPTPCPETGEYKPAKRLKCKLWVSKDTTYDHEWSGEGESAYRASNPDVAYSAEGIPVLTCPGLASKLLGVSRRHGIFQFEELDSENAEGVKATLIDEPVGNGGPAAMNPSQPSVFHGLPIPETFTPVINKRKKYGKNDELALCQGVDADSFSKLIYLSRARRKHFENADETLSGIDLFNALVEGSEITED